MAVKSVIEAVREAMYEEMVRDSKVFIMGEDVGKRGGVFLASQGFVEEFGEERVIDTPLAEASIVGIAVGAAFRGLRPIAEVGVCRLHLACCQPTHRRGGQGMLWYQWRIDCANGRASTLRWGYSRRPLPFPKR